MLDLCFIPAGGIEWGSSRMRCWWPARYLPGAAVATWDDVRDGRLPDARVYVFQKVADVALMAELRAGGARVVWDVCDPAWWFDPAAARSVVDAADELVASSWPLAGNLAGWSGRRVRMIPDRLDLNHFTHRREHAETRPIRLIWYGVAVNRMALYAPAVNLARLRANGHEVTLTLFDDAPDTPFPDLAGLLPVYYTRWSLAAEAETLAAHDVALLPSYPGPWGAVKSNNKTLTAWAAGLPVTSGVVYEELRALVCDVQYRREEAAKGLCAVAREWDVRQSAAEWQALVDEVTG